MGHSHNVLETEPAYEAIVDTGLMERGLGSE